MRALFQLPEGLSRGRGFSLVLKDLEGRMETNRQELQAERFPLNTSDNFGLLVWGAETVSAFRERLVPVGAGVRKQPDFQTLC